MIEVVYNDLVVDLKIGVLNFDKFDVSVFEVNVGDDVVVLFLVK